MSNKDNKTFNKQLFAAVASIKTPEEAEKFLKDILTRSELRKVATRLEVAKALSATNKSYRDISSFIPVSTTTVTMVSRSLKDDGYGGYKIVLDRMLKPEIK